MLKYNFHRLFRARGVEKPFSYMVRAGFSETFATRIVNHRMTTLNLREVERLCELLKCTPNDLLEWVPREDQLAEANHPLAPLRRPEFSVSLTQMLSSVPLDKLAEIEALIKSKIEE